jgi:hypothetical protein
MPVGFSGAKFNAMYVYGVPTFIAVEGCLDFGDRPYKLTPSLAFMKHILGSTWKVFRHHI